ncbi:hypothetical protein A2U01_0071421 [Trifolium medium]|uniref:Uncharacterized protein n=1 Tax=Trifolium medium TaxID=97028 RepID=A0A392SP42_9FABA|nr:hypothetical protein [Trifolium medium]
MAGVEGEPSSDKGFGEPVTKSAKLFTLVG